MPWLMNFGGGVGGGGSYNGGVSPGCYTLWSFGWWSTNIIDEPPTNKYEKNLTNLQALISCSFIAAFVFLIVGILESISAARSRREAAAVAAHNVEKQVYHQHQHHHHNPQPHSPSDTKESI